MCAQHVSERSIVHLHTCSSFFIWQILTLNMNNTNRDVRIIVEQRNKSERLVGGEQGCLWHSKIDREVCTSLLRAGCLSCCVPLLASLIMAYQPSPCQHHTDTHFSHVHSQICVLALTFTHSLTFSQAYSTFICGCGRGIKKTLIKMLLTWGLCTLW